MDAFSDPRVAELVGVFASQVGKTDCVNNILGSRMDANPGPMLVIQPTLAMAEAWSKDRLAPMLRDTPALRGKVKDARSRDSGNTVLHKQFPGGHLTVAGANSPASLASRPIRDVFFDEVDRYPPSAGTEGDPIKLASARTRSFWNSKKVYISSPGTRGASRLEKLWGRSDQRRYFVPCHQCGAKQTLRWDQVKWDKDPETGAHQPWTARYVCEAGGCAWNDLERRNAIGRGEWRASKTFRGCAGFHINALAAPWESCNLEHLVDQWLEAQGNPELLKVFINTVLADWWEEQYEAIDETGLLSRRESFPEVGGRIAVPAPCAVLTAGVDVQDNRLEVSVYGWGSGEESWCLAHDVLYGDPATPATWVALDEYLRRQWPRELGGVDYLRGTCVDTGGHHTQAAYDFCGAPGRFRGVTPDGGRCFVFATKGLSGGGDLWPRAHSTATTKVPLWTIKVDAGKEQVYGRLSIVDHGAGYVHFPTSLGDEFFRGLTAEKVEVKTDRKGFAKRTWKLKRSGARNEPLDCAVLAYAALWGLRANGMDLETEVARNPERPIYEPAAAASASVAAPSSQAESARSQWQQDPEDWLGDTRGWLGR